MIAQGCAKCGSAGGLAPCGCRGPSGVATSLAQIADNIINAKPLSAEASAAYSEVLKKRMRPLIHRDPTPEEAARQPILTPAEQLAAALPGAAMPEVTKPAEVSPTGTPLVPVRAVPYVVALITILGTVGALPTMGISLIPVAICNGCLAAAAILGALAGVASPGLRKQP